MLEGITWGDFAVIALASLILYFIVLIATGQLKLKVTTQKRSGSEIPTKKIWRVEEHPAPPVSEVPQLSGMDIQEAETEHTENSIDKNFAALESLAVELQDICAEAGTSIPKDVLSDRLRQQIAAYPTLNTVAFKGAISNLIVKAAAVDCNISFTTEEAEALWQ